MVDAQLWSALFDEERQKKCKLIGTKEDVHKVFAASVGDPIELIKTILAPPVTTDVIEGWNKRAFALKSETKPIKAVKMYHCLTEEMADLYDDIMRTAGALESHLEYLRGK